MHQHAASILVFLVACGSPAAPPVAPPAPDPHAEAVAGLVGAWRGQAADSPFGAFPFAIAFDREPSGDVHGRAEKDGMYLDFRFRREAGAWTLVTDGQIPGVGRQVHTLVPAPPGEAGPRWVEKTDARYVDVAVDVRDDRLVLTTMVRGELHAVFELQRLATTAAASAAR